MNDYIIFKNIDNKYITLPEALEENKEKHENTIFYATDVVLQSQYINMFKEQGIDVLVMNSTIDEPFINHLESKNEGVKFLSIDSDITDAFKEEVNDDDEEFKKTSDELSDIFKKTLNKDTLNVKVEKLKDESISSVITLNEESKRMQQMMKVYGMTDMNPAMFESGITLTLNANNDLVKYVLNHKDDANTEMICKQLYDLALISHKQLSADEMTNFIKRSNDIMLLLTKES